MGGGSIVCSLIQYKKSEVDGKQLSPPPPPPNHRGVQYFTVGSLGGFKMFSDSICDSKSLWGKEVTQDDNYGNMGCEVFKRGIQN